MHPPPAEQRLVDDAVAIARAAGATTLPWFRSADLVVDRKGDGTPVTVADRGAEAHVRAALAEGYPDDGIVGEEEGVTRGTSGRRWYVDPIDGTKAFTRGVPLYSTLLAVEDEHGLAVGVIHLPALDRDGLGGTGPRMLVRRRHRTGQRPTVDARRRADHQRVRLLARGRRCSPCAAPTC